MEGFIVGTILGLFVGGTVTFFAYLQGWSNGFDEAEAIWKRENELEQQDQDRWPGRALDGR